MVSVVDLGKIYCFDWFLSMRKVVWGIIFIPDQSRQIPRVPRSCEQSGECSREMCFVDGSIIRTIRIGSKRRMLRSKGFLMTFVPIMAFYGQRMKTLSFWLMTLTYTSDIRPVPTSRVLKFRRKPNIYTVVVSGKCFSHSGEVQQSGNKRR